MSSTIDYLNSNKLYIDHVIDATEYTEFKNKVIDQLCANVEIKGFRKGHAPREKALGHIDPQKLASTLMKEVLDHYTPDLMKELSIKCKEDKRELTQFEVDYDIEKTSENEDGSFKLRLIARLLPDIDLGFLDKISLPKINDKDIAFPTLKEFMESSANGIISEYNEYTDIDRAAKHGDMVTVEMSGEVDGKEVPTMAATDLKIIVGSGQFLPDFEKNMVGVKSGETKTFDLPFPDSYTPELAGKTAQATVKIKKTEETKYKTLEEVLKNSEKAQANYKDKADFETKVTEYHKQRVDQLTQQKSIDNAVMKTRKNMPEFEVEQEFLESQSKSLMDALKNEMEAQKMTLGEAMQKSRYLNITEDEAKSMDEKKAEKIISDKVAQDIRWSLLLSYVYRKHIDDKDKVSEQEFKNMVADAQTNPTKYGLQPNLPAQELESILNERVVTTKSVDWLVKKLSK